MRRPTLRGALILASLSAIATVYLFVQAPPPLAAAVEPPGTVPIRAVFAVLEHENDAARALWTSDIVNAGRAHGLAFDEHWRDDGIHAGPLPALFLRETARHLEREAPGLRLFLGSRYPINAANHFVGEQATHVRHLEADGAPQFFFEPATGLHTAMFADLAVADACVTCHNEHRDSPKVDWKLRDIMGATTWMYPDQTVTMQRAVELVAGLRRSIRAAYASYLDKAATFPHPPAVGAGWPAESAQLPSADVFMAELARRSSAGTLRRLLDPATSLAEDPPPPAPVAKKPPPPAAPPPDDILVIRATRATKVTVDHETSRLLVARLRAGGMASVSSRPPLRVTLDDAASVTLEYRGKPVATPDVEIVDDEDE